jgi:hypothetical protein
MTTTKVPIYLSQTADGFLCAIDAADVLLAKARHLPQLRARVERLVAARYGFDAKPALMVGRPTPVFMPPQLRNGSQPSPIKPG